MVFRLINNSKNTTTLSDT